MRKSLEDLGDKIPRGMVAHDKIRLIAFPLFFAFTQLLALDLSALSSDFGANTCARRASTLGLTV